MSRAYPDGRCRGISQAARRRCRGGAGHGPDGTLCATHVYENDPVTIDSDPETLIKTISGAYPARCRAIEHDGGRCTTGCGPTDRFCSLHKTISVPEVTDFLDEGELDVVLIQRALSADAEPRTMTDGGVPSFEDEPRDDYASVTVELTEDDMESLRHGFGPSFEFDREDGGTLAVHVGRADTEGDNEWLLSEAASTTSTQAVRELKAFVGIWAVMFGVGQAAVSFVNVAPLITGGIVALLGGIFIIQLLRAAHQDEAGDAR